MNIQSPATPDLTAVKAKQQATWASGDYAVVGTTLQIVGENLCEAVDLRSSQRVLDVAAGNGNATLAAARRFADVVSTDYVGALLERGRERARADRLPVEFREADAENLPFPDASFEVVLSTFGVMFTANHPKAAGELVRVCRPGGKIGLANWTPEGFIGNLLKTVGKAVPPPPGVKSPIMWGKKDYLEEIFGSGVVIATQSRHFTFRYKSPAHFLDIFRTYYGPTHKAFGAIDMVAQQKLQADILALIEQFNVAKDGTLVIPSEYLEIVITKRA
jgi:ubiquinone/menaquinone biosynthesis C-methylase UbiE